MSVTDSYTGAVALIKDAGSCIERMAVEIGIPIIKMEGCVSSTQPKTKRQTRLPKHHASTASPTSLGKVRCVLGLEATPLAPGTV